MKQDHIIQNQEINVEFQSRSTGLELKDELSETCKLKLLPAIEKLFDEYGEEEYFTFEKVEIDAGIIAFNNWQNTFVEQVINELKEKLTISKFVQTNLKSSPVNQNEFTVKNEETHEAEVLLYYIETGRLPWFSGKLKPDELKKSLANILHKSDDLFISKLKQILSEEHSVTRLIYQFEEEQLDKILSQLSFQSTGSKLIKAWKKLLSWLNITKQEQKSIVYTAAFFIVGKQNSNEIITRNFSKNILSALSENDRSILQSHLKEKVIIEELQNELAAPEIITEILLLPELNNDQNNISNLDLKIEDSNINLPENIVSEKKQFRNVYRKTEDEESFYISNSGLVILHSFLPALFKNVGYLQNNHWINDGLQQRAIALTNFLITGSEQLPEFNLLLNKIVCGYNIEAPILDFIELTDLEKNEAHDLLLAVINHWKALKNTSIDGLRSTFFMRDGKLSFRDNVWLLQVEQKTVDILLNKLPWSISIIKLPWMQEKLIVEWA